MSKTIPQMIGAAALTALLAGTALAGPLDPPNGPITSSYKTLTDVEPRVAINADNTPGDADSVYKITAPGSYYLTGNFSATSGKNGIEINGANITVDLDGFRIAGQGGSLDGIHVNGGQFGITIRNGVVYLAAGDGIDAVDASAVRIEDVTVLNSGGQGIVVGSGNTITRCTVATNGSHGINTADTCRVTDCVARGNTGVGIDVDDNSVVTGCTAESSGSRGFGANINCSFSNCTSLGNGENGFQGDTGCSFTDCSARGNTGFGIHTGNGYVSLARCSAQNNGQDGYYIFQRCAVSNCTAGGNTKSGFRILHGNVIKNCVADANTERGMTIEGGANLISENNCSQNTSSGIAILSNVGNRLEGNNVVVNGVYGIFIANGVVNNIVVRNSASGNTNANYSISAGNDYGVILTSPGSGFTSSAAWANFAY